MKTGQSSDQTSSRRSSTRRLSSGAPLSFEHWGWGLENTHRRRIPSLPVSLTACSPPPWPPPSHLPPPCLRSQLAECIKSIVACDYPLKWPELDSALLALMSTQEPPRLYCALLTLRVLARKYEYKDADERKMLVPLMDRAFPPLLGLTQHLLAMNSSSVEVAELLKLVLKTFWCGAERREHRARREMAHPCGHLLLPARAVGGRLRLQRLRLRAARSPERDTRRARPRCVC